MPLPALLALAAAAALVTVLVGDVAGSTARAKGRSYWAFFALSLLLWFPALIAALALPPRTAVAPAAGPRRAELLLGGLLLALAALVLAAAAAAVVAYAP